MISIWRNTGEELVTAFATRNAEVFLDKVSVNLFANTSFFVIDTQTSRNLTVNATLSNESGLFDFFTINVDELQKANSNQFTASQISNVNANIYQINVCWLSEVFALDVTELIVEVFDGAQLTCSTTIKINVESIEEETRYRALLANVKVQLDDAFEASVIDSNVDENNTDYEVLNRKRLEYLISQFEIGAYVGAYRGLLDALRFFGYGDDVALQEYWRFFDTELNRYILRAHNIENPYTTEVLKNFENWERTNTFGLFYSINEYTDNTIAADVPITQLINVFSNAQAAFVKITNVKILLEKHFLPAHVYIQDIVGNQYHQLNIREFNTIHNALIAYVDTNSYGFEYKFTYDTSIRKRAWLDFYVLTNAADLPHNRLTDFVFRCEKGFIDNDEILDVEPEQFDITDISQFNFIKNKYVVSNAALIQFQIIEGQNEWLAFCQNLEIRVTNSSGTIVFQEFHENPIIDPAASIPLWVQLAIDVKGVYDVSIIVLDFYGIKHIYAKKLDLDIAESDLLVWRHKVVPELPGLKTTFPTFKEMLDATYKTPLPQSYEIALETDIVQASATLETLLSNPMFLTDQIPTYDMEAYPNILGPVLSYSNPVTELYLKTPKINELKDWRISNTNQAINAYNACYTFMTFDIVGNGSAKTFNFALRFKYSDSFLNIPVNYVGHTTDLDDYIYLMTIASTLNTSSDEVYSLFNWNVRLTNFPTSIIGIYETRYVLVAFSKAPDSPIRFDVNTDTKNNIVSDAYRHVTYTDLLPSVQLIHTGVIGSILELQFDDVLESYNFSFSNLDELITELETNYSDKLIIYKTKVVLTVTVECLIFSRTGSFSIAHASIGGKLTSVFRKASVNSFVGVRHGSDYEIYEPIIATVDDSYYKFFDLNYELTNSLNEVVETTNSATFSWWTKLKKHQHKDSFTLKAKWTDKVGNVYEKIVPGVFNVCRELVDAKYETYNEKLIDCGKKAHMWNYISTKPKWYLPVVEEYIDYASDSQIPWILATGYWNDKGIWIDTSVWID